jgi:hypothetical protein
VVVRVLLVVRVLVIVVMGVAMIVRMVVGVVMLRRARRDAVNRHVAGESAAAILAHVTIPPGW